MSDCRFKGRWSPYLASSTWASSPWPSLPHSIGRLGIAGWVIVLQSRQLSFGRTWTTTLKCDGTYSSTSRVSSQILRSRSQPQAGQAQTPAFVMISRDR